MPVPSLRQSARAGVLCLFALFVQTANAVPVGSSVSGSRGEVVTATLSDSFSGLGAADILEAADIRVRFDPGFLTFLGATEGALTTGFIPLAGLPQALSPSWQTVDISLITGGPGAIGEGSVLVASFRINTNAPFARTSVFFETLVSDIYDFPETPAFVDVLADHQIPIGNTGALVLTALGAMALVARRPRPSRGLR